MEKVSDNRHHSIHYLCQVSRHLASCFLILSLTLPLAGTWTWLQLQKKSIKKTVKWKMIHGLSPDSLTLLRLSPSDTTNLNWKHSREFEYKGQMYDIVKTTLINDTTYYWCWWDHEETRLNKKLNILVNSLLSNNTQRKEHQNRLTSFLKSIFIETAVIRKNNVAGVIQLSDYVHLFRSRHRLSPPTPPPEYS